MRFSSFLISFVAASVMAQTSVPTVRNNSTTIHASSGFSKTSVVSASTIAGTSSHSTSTPIIVAAISSKVSSTGTGSTAKAANTTASTSASGAPAQVNKSGANDISVGGQIAKYLAYARLSGGLVIFL